MPGHVLMIDDDQVAHAIVAKALSADGIAVESAFDGSSGLVRAVEHPPDLILLDGHLPDIDGWKLCELLCATEATCRLPIIFLTASRDTESLVRALDQGAWDFLSKPFDPQELRARVRAAMRYGNYLRSESRRAMVDALTGLWNRRYFDHRLAAELASSERHGRALSCVIADIDHFKRFNDTYGHPAADEVLRIVAEVIRAACRAEDVPCRYGGEEFVILCPDVSENGASVLAERLRAGIAGASLNLQGERVACSFGVADCTFGPERLVWRADAALYRAKRRGRNRVECYSATPM